MTLTTDRAAPEKLKQCKSCPWRVDCEPERDIPNGYRSRSTNDSAPQLRH